MLGFRDDYDDFDEYEEVEYEVYDEPAEVKDVPRREYSDGFRKSYASRDKNQVVSIHASIQMEVVLSYPETLEEAGVICDYLKQNKTVIINVEGVSHELCQRIIDFLGGVTYALDGEIQSVSRRVFIVAPNNVDISGSFKEELRAKGLLFDFQEYEA